MADPYWGLGGARGYLGGGLGGARILGAGAPILAAGAGALPGQIISAPVSTSSLRAVPGAPSATQFQSGDEFRNFAFGYDNINSAETRRGNAAAGAVAGSYTNKATGHTINYVADGLGFRITGLGGLGRKKRSAQLGYAGGAIVASAPAARDAIRMNIQYNPGFASGYIVY